MGRVGDNFFIGRLDSDVVAKLLPHAGLIVAGADLVKSGNFVKFPEVLFKPYWFFIHGFSRNPMRCH